MDGPPPQEEDFTSIPIAERLSHKNWKARVNGYESLVKTFENSASDTDPVFKPYINNVDMLKKFATDSNAVAQEKGVECLVALVKFAGETAAKTRDGIVPALVDKCLGSTRAGTKNQAIELILQYVEVENGGVGVVTDVLVGLNAKQPKAVAGCILALKEAVRVFGAQVVPAPPILKILPKIFAHSDKIVRAEGSNLAIALYQYIGPGIEPWLADLKPVQVKELKDSFDALEQEGKGYKALKPDRLTRANAREVALQGEDDTPLDEEPEAAAPDPRSFAELVDIVPKLSPSLQTDLKSSKWKERKGALDDLATLLSNTLRIKDTGELSELTKSLALCIAKDANINCVIVAANCLEGLAKGMMEAFGKYREAVVPLMLERLKERKANVTDAIGSALDAVFVTTSLTSIIPDLDAALKSKNPQVKEGTLKFLGRCFASATSPIQPAQIKPMAESLAVLLEDGFEGARNEAATCFGCLMKMVGERPLNATMDTLQDMRKAKVKEAFEKAVVKCKVGAAAAPSRAPAASVKIAVPKAPPPDETEAASVKKPAPPPKSSAKPVPKKPTITAPTAKKPAAPTTATKTGKANTPAAAGNLDAVKYKHTPEDAEALAADLIPSSIMTDFGDANWKTRLAALEEMFIWLEKEVEALDAEVVVRALAKKGWGEKNFQVSAKLYGILDMLARQCPSFGRSCVALCVPHLTEKLGDLKLKKPAGDALLAYSEKTSLQFVLGQAYEPLSKQKAPKVLADAITWVNTALTDFGLAGLSLRNLIEFLKTALQNSNASVRTSATKTLVTVKLFAGSSIKDLLEDLNPQLLNTITAEFDKVEGQAAPDPCRTSADIASLGTAGSSKEAKAVSGDPLDDLFPRVELDALFKGATILTDAKSDAWKTKKEALEALQAILDQGSNKRLKPAMGEIGQILKSRVTDTNKAVQTLALDIVSRIATGMGKGFERHSRLFVLPISTVLSDQKATIRSAALQTLTAIAVACDGVESMVPGLTTALETTNPLQKATLCQWIVDWFKDHDAPSSLDLNPWAALVVSSLDDRSSDVRKAAQDLLPTVIRCAGFDFVMQQTNSLKPASRSGAIRLVQAAKPAAPINAPTPPITAGKVLTASDTPSPPPSESPPATIVPDNKPASKGLGVRRKLPLGISRPDSRADNSDGATKPMPTSSKSVITPTTTTKAQIINSAPQNSSLPFSAVNPEVKRSRLMKDANRWVNEGGPTRKDLAELLQSQMEPCTSKDLVARLFSHDHNAVNDYINGLGVMADFYSDASGTDENVEKLCIANLDLPLKYVSLKAHEPQPNLISKCLDVVEAVLAFLRHINHQLTDNEAMCFVPTMIYKLGDAREQVRIRVQQIIKTLPMLYAYSRLFQMLLDYGLKAKVAKTRQGTLDELSAILKKSGMGACEPSKAFPSIATMLSDKDPQVRKSALGTLSEAYSLVGEKVWSLVGPLSSKDKTQLEERLRRVPGPSSQGKTEALPIAPGGVTRLMAHAPRPASPSITAASRIARPASPANALRTASPVPSQARSESPLRPAGNPVTTSIPTSPGKARPRSMLPSRLGRLRPNPPPSLVANLAQDHEEAFTEHIDPEPTLRPPSNPKDDVAARLEVNSRQDAPDEITLTISSILSSDPTRSVDALKKIQRILSVGPDKGPSSPQYRELAEHTEGLIETITLQMAHIFEHPDDLIVEDNFRLAKHLIQTLNNFCDHVFLAESLTVDILTALLEELTLRLLETDDSPVKKIKELSRFINMIILRLFATGRRMSIFRALFALLLQIVKPFPSNGVLPDSKESKVAELVLKCVWKLARNIPQDLSESLLDPVELFPAIEHFLQSVPPNEWRARATNKVPCGDMPLRTIKVIVQHIVAHYGDDVYELLSASFDDPSATIVYPYVYRILNSGTRNATEAPATSRRIGNANLAESVAPSTSPGPSRPISPQGTTSSAQSAHRPPSHRTSPSSSSAHGHGLYSPNVEEPDPDAQLIVIIGHISSETTGALHKEGITELHHFLKAYPHKKPRVEKLLESTGAAFRKYINRALATRAAEDQERNVAVADTLSRLEFNARDSGPNAIYSPTDATPKSPSRVTSVLEGTEQQEKLSRLHDIFQYRSSTLSAGSSHGRTTPGLLRHPVSALRLLVIMPRPRNELKKSFTYDAAMLFWRTITQIFFREVRPRGAFHIPREGPVIFVGAPHNNQFLDPLLLSLEVYRETHRHVQFLTAAKSMERKAVGFFARLMDSIPVSRAADSATPGTGRIWLSPDDPCLVLGEGTKFLTELSPRMQLMLPKSVNSAIGEVSEVLSDTELRLKREFGGESGKGTARIREKLLELRHDGIEGLDYKKMPFVDQQEMYRHVYQCLNMGGSIGIFPEGGSHDRTDLLPLKAGVSIMALGAMANDSNVRVKIVPVGLSYFHAHRFRSRAVVEFGTALDVPSELVEMFKLGGQQKREAVAKFLDLVYDALKTVTIRAPDYDTLMLIQAVRRLYKTPGQYLTLGQVVELNRKLLEGYVHFQNEPQVQKLRKDVLKYNRLVRNLGLRDHQVPRAQKASWKTLGLLIYRICLLLFWTLLALPGTILNGPVFILASIISRKKAKEALAASVVKIAGRDVLATWKVLIALGVTPVLYTLYAIVATAVATRAGVPIKWRICTPFLVIILLPFMNYAALKFGEAGMDVLKSLPPLIVALIPGQQRSLGKIKTMRVQLSNEVASLINHFGPQLYEDFNESRILVPSASAPPSSGNSGLWRRTSSTGAVDAQGLGLIHPMTWIDERLFGWSRSSKRGTSAWSGTEDPSRTNTPDESDEEDAGDYDNVIGLIPANDDQDKARSRQNSYADLQRLRQNPTGASGHPHPLKSHTEFSNVDHQHDQLEESSRLLHRPRRPSLSDDVPVERIAAVDPTMAFSDATESLNEEMTQAKFKSS